MATAGEWLGKLANLKVDRARGDPAPHKPLLVLVLLQMAEEGQLSTSLDSCPSSASWRSTSSSNGLCGAGSPRARSTFRFASFPSHSPAVAIDLSPVTRLSRQSPT